MKKLLFIFILFSGNLFAQKIELPDSIKSLLLADTTVNYTDYLEKTQGKGDREGSYFASYYNPHFIKERRTYLTHHRIGNWRFYRKDGSIRKTEYIPYKSTNILSSTNYRKDGSIRFIQTLRKSENLKASAKRGKGPMFLQKVKTVWYYKNGNIFTVDTQVGLRNIGDDITYYKNGQMKTKFFRNLDHKREGKYWSWDKDGSVLWDGQYKNGKRIGIWKVYDKDGNLKKEKNYKEKNR